jgi:hypothetical protein
MSWPPQRAEYLELLRLFLGAAKTMIRDLVDGEVRHICWPEVLQLQP